MPAKVCQLSNSQARSVALRAQGLAHANPGTGLFGSGISGAQAALEHLGYVQVDTISVVQRAHHHVLWTRVPGYEPRMLHELQDPGRAVFEYWTHAASYLPMRDFRFSLPRMREFRCKFHWADSSEELDRAMKQVLRSIRANGPVQLRDFESGKRIDGAWGPSKIERRALHELWMRGKVMIRSRSGFQKVYDLPERIVPEGTDLTFPTATGLAEFRVRGALRAHGILRARDLGHLSPASVKAGLEAAMRKLVRRGEAVLARVDGTECFANAELLEGKEWDGPPAVHILSPFDNLVIQRDRLRWLFHFDYQIECYVPAPKRKHGYFVLPILVGDQFIGRMDTKAGRSTGRLAVLSLFFEPGLKQDRELWNRVEEAIERFAVFNGCASVEFSRQASAAVKALF